MAEYQASPLEMKQQMAKHPASLLHSNHPNQQRRGCWSLKLPFFICVCNDKDNRTYRHYQQHNICGDAMDMMAISFSPAHRRAIKDNPLIMWCGRDSSCLPPFH
eukprot:7816426-Ditylum_brightwellii.AAC.1